MDQETLNKRLYKAVDMEDLKLVKSCLAKGADPNKAFGLALMKNNLPICHALINGGLKPSRIMIASRSRYRYGPTGEYSYLGYAASKNMVEIMRALIDKGASLDGQVCGYTAIMIAAKRGKTLAVKELLAHKGHHTDSVRWALCLAARYGRTPSVKALLEYDDPDVFSYDSPKEKALMIAIEKNHTNVVKALISHGADVSKIDGNQFSPLMWASMHSDVTMVELLLGAGADPTLANSRGMTPLHCALSGETKTDNAIALMKGGALTKASGD